MTFSVVNVRFSKMRTLISGDAVRRSLAIAHTATVIRPVKPAQLVPFTLQWNPSRAHTTAVARFVHAALTTELPPGWYTQPDHLHHCE